MILSDVFGSAAAVLSTGAFIPQVLKTWQSKKAEDVSYVLLIAFCSGCFCWIIYGYMTKAYAVLIANMITFSLNLVILAMKFFFERKMKE
ncbi:MAG: SemiSWEET transporter [Synechococcus sp.]|tara:strand:+ start:3608 stop:3877 length:270 start_codon:yes stop_codon:yes gene_type:complete